MLLRLFLFLFFACFSNFSLWAYDSQHKIVYLISGPRALSTVFLRMMESRGDFIVYNEPTIPVYDRVHYKDLTEGWFRKDANITFEDVKKRIFDSVNESNVFIKDMSFSSHEYILKDRDFMQNPSIYFLILVRNPHHTSISFYQKQGDIVAGMSDLIGLKKLYEEYETIKKTNPNGVKIIFSEQLYETPRATMSAFCSYLGLPFLESAFVWKGYDEKFDGHNLWHEQKVGNHIHHWHGRAIRSLQMEKPHSYETDKYGIPTFNEITNDLHRSKMKEIYHENLIYYKKFLQAEEVFLLPMNDGK